MSRFLRDMLRDVEGYTPGEQLERSDIIKLNTNENPYPPSPRVLEALRNLDIATLTRYPNAVSLPLRQAAAARYGLPGPEWVFAGNGMDEILAMTIRTFVDPGETVVSVKPTYSLYDVLVRLHGADYTELALTSDNQLPQGLYSTAGELCFVPRPHAPTGTLFSRADMERLCSSFDGIVFIDEAYVDFAEDSCMDFPARFDNVIVGRTFSKSFSLAGLRVGLAVAHPDLIAGFLKTKDSYNLNAASQAAALAALEDYDTMLMHAEKIKVTRKRLTEGLRDLGFEVPESHSNFVLATRLGEPSAKDIMTTLRDRNILVRYFDLPGLEDSLRISIGTDAEIDALLAAMKEIIAG
jgi:histidinol-phosphate aminotransferase